MALNLRWLSSAVLVGSLSWNRARIGKLAFGLEEYVESELFVMLALVLLACCSTRSRCNHISSNTDPTLQSPKLDIYSSPSKKPDFLFDNHGDRKPGFFQHLKTPWFLAGNVRMGYSVRFPRPSQGPSPIPYQEPVRRFNPKASDQETIQGLERVGLRASITLP